MLSDTQRRRYARNISLPEMGEEGQKKLAAARIGVVGAGGLGSPLLTYLAAAGVGHIGIADHDRVELSNLQRQILHEDGDIGRLKIESARDRLEELNPECHIALHQERITEKNARDFVKSYDIIADGSDNFATRFAVSDACALESKPLVTAALRGWDGQLAVFKSYLGTDYPCYRCFVSASPDDERGCRDIGVIGAFAGVLGSMQALEVIKEILNIGTLTSKLFSLNGLTFVTKSSLVLREPACHSCSTLHSL